MGIFDYVNAKIPCFKCGEMLAGWQTKDGNVWMNRVDPDTVSNFYDQCHKCKTWNEYTRTARPRAESRKEPYELDEVLAMGFRLDKGSEG